jgi:hypothetical protein
MHIDEKLHKKTVYEMLTTERFADLGKLNLLMLVWF